MQESMNLGNYGSEVDLLSGIRPRISTELTMLEGGNIALGYWKDEKATNETFLPDGWLHTGDRFRVDENGFFL